jgi:tetratricopeptide (TPR) repeat protein
LQWYSDALVSFDKAIEIKPDYHWAWCNRGVALNKLGQFEEAIASLDKAIKINPDYNSAWNKRGLALYDLGRYEDAIASYDKAIKIKPDYYDAWFNRGVALGNLGRDEEVIASFDKAIKIEPDFYKAWAGRGIAAGNLVSYNQLPSLLIGIVQTNPILNQRGYEGELASYEEGLKYCQQDTHPEGWGKLHQAIGNAHYFRGRGDSYPRVLLVQSC